MPPAWHGPKVHVCLVCLLPSGSWRLGKSPPACSISIQTSLLLPSTAVVPVQAAVKAPADNDIKESHCASGTRAFLTVTTSLQQTQQSVTKLQSEC